ncbi:Putative zinc- or iron-chelating domain protein [Candidatus Bilamarchaeum dharawalense]|uniref:Zinc- or iron-chelating domain protein n=1 Tax=Candidatus Bilamarchaeum dharawalense TaxID=2885759 RepID=A0A5E4LR38_9ARCH|nr:Putative zinc- or iron-chelating domain protein [Candidatus Bilamarchaeum dharawalense]
MGSCLQSGKCCTSFGVCVTPFDLLRISKAIGLKPEDIVQFIPEPPNRERTEPAVIVDTGKFLMVLKWKKELICMFYSGSGCNIYEDRPMLCRTYPFCLKNGKFSEMKSRVCPSSWIPEAMEKKQYLADLKQYEKEVMAYRLMVEKWNGKGGGSFIGFLKYSIKEAKKLSKLF